MADFCKQCHADLFGPDSDNDLKGCTEQAEWDKGQAALVICEGCGPIQVDPDGNCVSHDCLLAGSVGHGLPWKTPGADQEEMDQLHCTGHVDYDPRCSECGQRGCNGECAGDDMMGASG